MRSRAMKWSGQRGEPHLAAHTPGMAYLICPRLLEHDPRFGEHLAGQLYPLSQEHGEHGPDCGCLVAPGGHMSNLYAWRPGARPYTAQEWPHCDCGQALVWSDLDHPGHQHEPATCPRGCSDGA